MILLGNGRMLTRDDSTPYFEDGCVAMEGDSIADIGETAELKEKYPQAEFIDARRGVIMPGLINAHSKLGGIFSAGQRAAGEKKSYLQTLESREWALDRKMKLADTEAAADCALIRCIENGVTTVFAQHAGYGEVPGSLEAVADSAERLGVRLCLSFDISDREGERKMKQAVKENLALIERAKAREDDTLAAMMGLHAQFTLSDATLDYVASKTPKGTGYCVHVADSALDVTDSLNKHGIRPVFRLYDFGIIGRSTIFCDCTHVSEREMDVIKNNDTMIVHSPQSSMANALGCAPLLKLAEKGILTGLGTDGFGFDMFESVRTGCLLQRHELGDAAAADGLLPLMLLSGNAQIAARFFRRPLGVIKRGAHADVIVLDYTPSTPMDAENAAEHLLFGLSGAMTRTTIIGGQPRMLDGELCGLDREAVFAHARERFSELQKRAAKK